MEIDRGISFDEAVTAVADAKAEAAAAAALRAERDEEHGNQVTDMRGVGRRARDKESVTGFWINKKENPIRKYKMVIAVVDVELASSVGSFGQVRVYRPETGTWGFKKQ